MSKYLEERRMRMLGIAPAKVEEKKPAPIAKKSEKLKQQEKEYNKIKKEMLAESDRCEMGSPVCTGKATGLQHKKRRGVNLTNRKYLLRSCNSCNGYAEQFPLWALENGVAISVHKIS